jgi:hypothetical protein
LISTAPQGLFRILRIEDGESAASRPCPMRERQRRLRPNRFSNRCAGNDASASFAPELIFLDLPVLSGSDETGWARAAGLSVPWRRIALSSSVESEGYAARTTLTRRRDRHAGVRGLAAGTVEGRIDLKGQ